LFERLKFIALTFCYFFRICCCAVHSYVLTSFKIYPWNSSNSWCRVSAVGYVSNKMTLVCKNSSFTGRQRRMCQTLRSRTSWQRRTMHKLRRRMSKKYAWSL